MTYFFDNNIAPGLVRALRELGVEAVALRERYPANTKDADWLRELSGTGYIVVTGDRKILSRDLEVSALDECGVPALFFNPFWSKMKFWEQAAWLTKHWPSIAHETSGIGPRTYLAIQQNGRTKPITPR